MSIIRVNINTAKIDKSALFEGTKGKYLNITLLENKDGEDQYGNNFMVVQDIGKDRRDAGEKGAILGNAKYVKAANETTTNKPASKPVVVDDGDDESIPF